jgi:hypothetical protein
VLGVLGLTTQETPPAAVVVEVVVLEVVPVSVEVAVEQSETLLV